MFNLSHQIIKMKKEDLITALKANREIHEKEYTEAVTAYLQRVEDDLKEALKIAKKQDLALTKRINFYQHSPENHLKDFDKAIQMLEYTQEDVIEIDSKTFSAFVNNEWDWTNNFKQTLDRYKVAGSMLAL